MTVFFRSNLAVILLSIALTACGASPQIKKARHIENGDKFFAAKQYKEALTSYVEGLKIDANDKTIYLKMAAVFTAVGDYKECITYLKKARDVDSEDLDIRLKLARSFAALNNKEDSRRELEFILDKDPQYLDAQLLLSELAEKPEEIEEGISRLQGLKVEPAESARVNLILGKLFIKKRDLAKEE